MEYLQYIKGATLTAPETEVLNLIINGIPSILKTYMWLWLKKKF